MPLTKKRVLRWLVDLEESDPVTLQHGDLLLDAARRGGVLEAPATWDDFARALSSLKVSGAVSWDYNRWPGETSEPLAQFFGSEHLQRCANIQVAGTGYAMARDDRPTTAISISGSTVRDVVGGDLTTINVVGLFERWEEQVLAGPGDDADKHEALTRLRHAKQLLLDAGSGTVAGVLAQALASAVGLH